jgi:hypothetical protein
MGRSRVVIRTGSSYDDHVLFIPGASHLHQLPDVADIKSAERVS